MPSTFQKRTITTANSLSSARSGRGFFGRSLLAISLIATTLLVREATAQTDPSSRLQKGVEGKNKYRGAESVGDMNAVKQNMKELFDKIIISSPGDNRADKWMSPHLRDILWSGEPKNEEVYLRKQSIPMDFMFWYCMNPFNPPIEAACPFTVRYWWIGPYVCQWHDPPNQVSKHRPAQSCFQKNSRIYEKFTTNSNWKVCCVDKDQVAATTEEVVSKHPDGDGWSGLYEFYYPVSALGWENDRTTSMIVDKEKVKQCVEKSDQKMENQQAQDWVSKSIELNLKQVSKLGGGAGDGGALADIQKNVSSVIKEVRPQDKQLRFSDSLQSEGLTVRPNLATLDPEYRKLISKRFCGRPEQFDKIMNPPEDNVQKGGGLSLKSLDSMPVWSNYCPQGVDLMTRSENSNLENIDKTGTDFTKGMKAWKEDPLYCQRMHLTNPNMAITEIDKAILENKGSPLSQDEVGHTCLDNDKLNGGMVPITLNRHAAVERRTAIADHALAFLIAGRLAEGMRSGQKSYLKGFEPQPYSFTKLPEPLKVFRGRRFGGGGTNELERVNPAYSRCESLSGENYQFQDKADRLYISNKTHESFTQKMIDDKNKIDKYVQEWADSQKDKISNRGLDKESQNYATAFRIMAMCPAGKVRWRPLQDQHNNMLPANLEATCKEEYFGGIP